MEGFQSLGPEADTTLSTSSPSTFTAMRHRRLLKTATSLPMRTTLTPLRVMSEFSELTSHLLMSTNVTPGSMPEDPHEKEPHTPYPHTASIGVPSVRNAR